MPVDNVATASGGALTATHIEFGPQARSSAYKVARMLNLPGTKVLEVADAGASLNVILGADFVGVGKPIIQVAGAAVSAPPTAEALAPEPTPSATSPTTDYDAVIYSGGLGAILRSSPVTGARVDVLQDGNPLQVLERRQTSDGEWVRVRSQGGEEGWLTDRVIEP
jgi:hypothetical protein